MVAKKKTPNFLSDLKEGTLHKALGYKEKETIPTGKINEIVKEGAGGTVKKKSGETVKITPKLVKKANFARSAASWHKGRK